MDEIVSWQTFLSGSWHPSLSGGAGLLPVLPPHEKARSRQHDPQNDQRGGAQNEHSYKSLHVIGRPARIRKLRQGDQQPQ
jgi:hypothetical protein